MEKLKRCEVCEERPQIARGMCGRCYGKLYYEENREKLKKYYRKQSRNPEVMKRNKENRKKWYYEKGGKELQQKRSKLPEVKAKKKKYMTEYNQRPYVKKKKREYMRRKRDDKQI